MLASMSLELQRQHGNMDAHIITMHLKQLFDVARTIVRCKTSKKLFCYKMIEDSSV